MKTGKKPLKLTPRNAREICHRAVMEAIDQLHEWHSGAETQLLDEAARITQRQRCVCKLSSFVFASIEQWGREKLRRHGWKKALCALLESKGTTHVQAILTAYVLRRARDVQATAAMRGIPRWLW